MTTTETRRPLSTLVVVAACLIVGAGGGWFWQSHRGVANKAEIEQVVHDYLLEHPEVLPDASEADIRSVVWTQLKTCYDPEIPINIVDLGLIYECEVSKNEDQGRTVSIKMTLTAPGCGMGEVLVQDVRDKVEIVPTVTKADVELVFDPPWSQSMMSEAARLQTGMM